MGHKGGTQSFAMEENQKGVIKMKHVKLKGFCNRCGAIWCDVHNCCPLDCFDKHCKPHNKPATLEAFDVVTTQWYPICDDCYPVFLRLAQEAEKITGLNAEKRFRNLNDKTGGTTFGQLSR